MTYICFYVYTILCCNVVICSAVSDADGDTVRCRWAESAQGECGDLCQYFSFPATLDQVGYITSYVIQSIMYIYICMHACIFGALIPFSRNML